MKLLLLTLATLVAFTGSVRAETAVPDHFVIGHDNEGEIDADSQTCLAELKDMTKNMKDAREACAARKRHVEAYAVMQGNYKNFVNAFRGLTIEPPGRGDSGSSVHGSQVRPHHRRP